MTRPLVDPDPMQHPCETAFESLLAIRPNSNSLFLALHTGPRIADADMLCGRFRWGYPDRHVAHPKMDDTFEMHCTDAPILPFASGICALVLLRLPDVPGANISNLRGLIKALQRVLAPGGEIVLLYGAPSASGDGTAGPSHTFSGITVPVDRPGRVAQFARALDLRWWVTLRRTLRLTGFHHAEWFVPEYAPSGMPTRIHLLKGESGVRPLGVRNWLRVMSRHCVLVRASREALQTSMLHATLDTLRQRFGSDAQPVTIDSILVSPKEKLVIMARIGADEAVLRIPFSLHAQAGCVQNMRALRRLQAEPDIAKLVPKPILEGEHGGRYFSFESRIRGTPLRHVDQGEAELRIAEALLRALNPASVLRSTRLEGARFDKLVTAPLAAISRLPALRHSRELLEGFFFNSLHGSLMAEGVSHGDFSVRNIYLDHGEVSGVIDWDEGVTNGLPVLDAIGHLLSRQSRRSKGFTAAIARLATRQWPVDYELDFLDRSYTYFGVEQNQHFALVMLQWLRVVGNQSQHWFAQRDAFADEYILPIMALIADRTRPEAADLVAEAVRPRS